MAESLLLPVVEGLAGKAANALVQTVTRMCGLDDDRQTLVRHLLAVQCKLGNAEERSQTNAYLRSWMEKLKAIAYEADDVLDDFQYEALRREAQIGKSTSRKVLSYVTCRSPLLFRFAMRRKLKGVLEKIKGLVEEMNMFGLENSLNREGPQLPWRQTHSKLDESTNIFGRGDDKEGVVKLLLDQQDQRKVQMLPIFGMGGLGKTALAKMLYNDQEVHQHFQLKMWHCVSDNFDVIAIVKSIIELAIDDLPEKEKALARKGSWYMSGSIELLQKKLDEVIGQKRFLLVLDDVWNEEKRMWEDELRPLLCYVGGPGSVIVVTCRSKQVASMMCTIKPHELAFLGEEDSWELFSNKAFSNGVEEQAELVTIGRRIVNKCGGLPLALKTMGGLLSSKQQVPLCKEGGGHSTPLPIFPKLKMMVLEGLRSLEGWAENSAGVAIDSLVTFPVLENVQINDFPKLANFPLSPVLKVLNLLDHCPEVERLRDIPRLPASLEILRFQCFGGLVVLPSNLGDLAKLSDLRVHDCKSLKGLPDGMDGLTSPEIGNHSVSSYRGIPEWPPSAVASPRQANHRGLPGVGKTMQRRWGVFPPLGPYPS